MPIGQAALRRGARLPGARAPGARQGPARDAPVRELPRRPRSPARGSTRSCAATPLTAGLADRMSPHTLRHTLRHPPAGRRLRPALGAGDARPRRRGHDPALHAPLERAPEGRLLQGAPARDGRVERARPSQSFAGGSGGASPRTAESSAQPMPELPEVETIRRQLAPALEGRRLERLEVLDPRWCEPAPPEAIEDALRGRDDRAGRPARQVPDRLARGRRAPGHAPAHDRQPAARPRDARGPAAPARAHRPRRRAALLFWTCAASAPATCCSAATRWPTTSTSRLGVEPLSPDFTAEALRALARGRKRRSRRSCSTRSGSPAWATSTPTRRSSARAIHPLRPVGTLKRAQIEALRDAVVETLEAGHRRARAPRSTTSATPTARAAASRTASSCTRARASRARAAATTIEKLRAAGRGTYVCPRCQPRPRVRRPAARS